ncbi:histidine kinase [Streptomyces sp. NPDC001732]
MWRERRPGLVSALITAASVLVLPLNVLNGADAARIVALYNVGRYGRPRRLALACTVTAAQLIVRVEEFWGSGHLQHAKRPEMITLLALLAVTACAGLALPGRLAKAYIVTLETERDQQTRLTAARERTHVFREMHDILGHTLAVVVGLADGAAALARSRSEKSADTLALIVDSGREALAELRRLLIVNDAPQRTTTPPRCPRSRPFRTCPRRPTADLRTEGDLAPLSPALQLTAYRIVQPRRVRLRSPTGRHRRLQRHGHATTHHSTNYSAIIKELSTAMPIRTHPTDPCGLSPHSSATPPRAAT